MLNLKNVLYNFYRTKYLKYREEVLTQEQMQWEKYRIKNQNNFICGIDNSFCLKDCNGKEYWEQKGCMYLKGYKDY